MGFISKIGGNEKLALINVIEMEIDENNLK